MSISFWTYFALALVMYFGWALVDPKTVQEVEEHLARKPTARGYGNLSQRLRNSLGLGIGVLLLGISFYADIARSLPAIQQEPEAAAPAIKDPGSADSRPLMDRIDNATLQKQIEHQQEMSRYDETPPTVGS